jgi:LPXTG-motif cell wall-anchored protein
MSGRRFAVWVALAALFATGMVAAFGGGSGTAANKLTTLTLSTETTLDQTTTEQTTVEPTTVVQTVTNTQTIRSRPSTVIVNPATTAKADTSSGTETWVLVAIGVGIVALIALIAWLASRRRKELPGEARRRALADAVAAWVAQGWAPVSQTDTTAVLQRNGEHTVLTVDAQGNIDSQAVGPAPPGATA